MIRVLIAVGLLGVGWLLGSFFPAPPQVTDWAATRGGELADRLEIEGLDWQALQERLSPEQFASLRETALDQAAQRGEAIVVEREAAPEGETADTLPEPAAAPPPAGFQTALELCPRMTVSNAPAVDGTGALASFAPVVSVNGVEIAVAPTTGACLSSGFGVRNGRAHKGIDLHNEMGGPVVAGGAGKVLEKKYRDDYGNMLLIDHGSGVHTRYAHLSSFAEGIAVGVEVKAGQPIGLMGNTASYPIPVHLHYELLLGDYANPKGAFGLTPRSVFDFGPVAAP